MKLTLTTINEIQYRLDVLQDELGREQDEPGYMDADMRQTTLQQIAECSSVLATGRPDALQGTHLLRELDNTLGNMIADGESEFDAACIYTDLARAGYHNRYDPEAVFLGGKPRKATVDGVTYENWYGFTYRQPTCTK